MAALTPSKLSNVIPRSSIPNSNRKDSNEFVESVVKDSAEIETDHFEGYCEKVLAFGLKKDLIEQIVASLPPTTRLEYLQFFNEDFHLVLQTDFNNPDDIESALVDCLINLKDCSLHRTYGQLA